MDHAALVRVGKRPRHFLHQLRRQPGRQRPRALYALAQRLAVHEAHHEEHQVAPLLDGVNRDDVGVGEPGGGARLLEEAVAEFEARREVARQQFDGDQAVQRHVARQQHDAHAAPAQLALDRVSAGEHLLERQEFRAIGLDHLSKANQV